MLSVYDGDVTNYIRDFICTLGNVFDAAENRITRIGPHEMLSIGWSNHTPWDTPRECSEEELAAKIDALAAQIEDMDSAIFNIHVPPFGTGTAVWKA